MEQQQITLSEKAIFDLTGKVAIITGASKGIGEDMARVFARFGAKVVISSRKQDACDALASDIRAQGGEATGIAAHVGDMAQLQQLVDKSIATYGGIDILVNNAASNPVFGPSLDCDGAAFDKIMQANVKAPFELSKLCYSSMKARGGGSIIMISSIAGHTPDPGLGMYSVSKASLNMLTKVLAKEWGPDGIRVNAICPGLIKTKFSQALWQNESILEHFTNRIPIARMGTVDEISPLALFLASSASSYSTGSLFYADGGTVI
ncbi:SDR family NAD(P)-dependent oxidoreductase [Spirosoma fluviale]|uniref:NAD(P)-dependent dehydrogenase, short-chain alcohol dehydrogenase family n=1 Tax=Spirosoma fluviale TaxID=1597977 RepID=A0A286FAN5_9BACT|nr:glucose 1-dehydrogenase [Spirosoma fluviale]SOD80156.1 NAD(P)-dependent dehydrogenase, short-chain alcohol dehydrogenase family [Spirosoma fluviale]